MARLLTKQDTKTILTTLGWLENRIPPLAFEKCVNYFNTAFVKNANKSLLSHERDDWQLDFGYRGGGDTVMGTLCEYVSSTRWDTSVFLHDIHSQVVEETDYVAGDIRVSVKKNAVGYKTILRSNYFTEDATCTHLDMVDLDNQKAYLFKYRPLEQFYNSTPNKIVTHTNTYVAVDTASLVRTLAPIVLDFSR